MLTSTSALCTLSPQDLAPGKGATEIDPDAGKTAGIDVSNKPGFPENIAHSRNDPEARGHDAQWAALLLMLSELATLGKLDGGVAITVSVACLPDAEGHERIACF